MPSPWLYSICRSQSGEVNSRPLFLFQNRTVTKPRRSFSRGLQKKTLTVATLYSPHKSVSEVLHKRVNLKPVGGHASRPATRGKKRSVCSSSVGADCVLGSKILYSICALYHNHSWTLTPATCWIIVLTSLCPIAATSAVTTLQCSWEHFYKSTNQITASDAPDVCEQRHRIRHFKGSFSQLKLICIIY